MNLEPESQNLLQSPIMVRTPVETQDLLKQVSRSFYLTLRILPRSIRYPISIAYLLARASDTIADTKLIGIERRHEALRQFRETVGEICRGGEIKVPDLGDLAEAQEIVTGEGTPGERKLLEHLTPLLHSLKSIDGEDRFRIGKLLATITEGQGADILKFDSRAEGIEALQNDQDLDAYIYAVAGCVGEFWTEMCRVHVFPAAQLNDEKLRTDGVRFGKGLQLVNILRDLPNDLRRRRCYIPRDRLSDFGLRPEDLLNRSTINQFRPLYDTYVQLAEDHLSAGGKYTLSLPFRCVRIRLACAWPVLIGGSTLKQLRSGNVLDHQNRIKVNRAEIRRLMLKSLLFYPFPRIWSRLVDPRQSAYVGGQ